MNPALSKSEKASYLANVLCVARAEGGASGEEALVFSAVVERIGADEQDLMAARALLGDGHYQVRLMREPGVRLANAQDMVMMALADGAVSTAESVPIEKLAQIIRFSQADMDLMVRRAEAELHRLKRKQQREPASLQPGRTPSETPRRTPPPPPHHPARTQSPPPPPAPARERHKPAPPPAAPAAAAPPAAAPAPPPPPAPTPPAGPTPLERCRACRAQSQNPAEYCFGCGSEDFNIWGCRLARMPWSSDAAWLRLGSFRDDETFVFDKHAIGRDLTAALQVALNCPHLDTAFVESAFEAMPPRASIWGHWTLHPAPLLDPDGREVTVKRFVQGCPVLSTARVNGVQPDGRREAIKVIARALRRSGRTDVTLRVLAQEP